MKEIIILPKAKRSLKKLSKQHGKEMLLEFKQFIFSVDNILSSSKVKKLKGIGFYRYRFKTYRLIFDVNGIIVAIIDVRKREEKTYKL
jgi:mRNA-degrading endonuclease RelE of RelBE toxin-antitoxin system